LPRDSVLRISTPAGGGYGAVRERERAAIERDVLEGRIGADTAGTVYGYQEPS
jgi:N-methylhydantoinase B/oxoprolinase/acetone carboxylase alpha subunit